MERTVSTEELECLKQASLMLLLPTSTWATGTVLFHRYCKFVNQSKPPKDLFNSRMTIMLCLYLATKVTEEPRKQRDIINVGYHLENPQNDFLPIGSQLLNSLRETMTQCELILMRALGFNMNVELPHTWIASIIYGMAWWEKNGNPPDDTEDVDKRIKRVAALAWEVANEAVRCGLVDCYPARSMAAACIAISMDAHGEPFPAKNFDEWTDIWAKSSASRISQARRLIEDSVSISSIIGKSNRPC
ncbi:cyclin-like protein [Coemansia spiralis]|nr:cyclin-like protein [Coemansia spiralis]